jgi:hypothetical protein
MLVFQDENGWAEWTGQCVNGAWHSRNIESLPQSTPDVLVELGLYPATIVGSAPTRYHVESGRQYAVVGNAVEITRTWSAPPIEDIRASACAYINLWKIQKQDGGFSYAGAVFDSDPRSRANITGAVLKAVLSAQSGQPMTIDWTDQGNVPHTMDGLQIIGLGMAAAAHVENYHVLAQSKKADVANASTAADVDAIVSGLS